ncbi:hypothetical protein DSTSK_01790 [Desulforhabdus sp. TSK]|nr:hypothetical protein DSTSK_01790 [Desulforhabdus sp. TSK]
MRGGEAGGRVVELPATAAVVPYLPVGAAKGPYRWDGSLPLLQGRFTNGRFTNRPYDVHRFSPPVDPILAAGGHKNSPQVGSIFTVGGRRNFSGPSFFVAAPDSHRYISHPRILPICVPPRRVLDDVLANAVQFVIVADDVLVIVIIALPYSGTGRVNQFVDAFG